MGFSGVPRVMDILFGRDNAPSSRRIISGETQRWGPRRCFSLLNHHDVIFWHQAAFLVWGICRWFYLQCHPSSQKWRNPSGSSDPACLVSSVDDKWEAGLVPTTWFLVPTVVQRAGGWGDSKQIFFCTAVSGVSWTVSMLSLIRHVTGGFL